MSVSRAQSSHPTPSPARDAGDSALPADSHYPFHGVRRAESALAAIYLGTAFLRRSDDAYNPGEVASEDDQVKGTDHPSDPESRAAPFPTTAWTSVIQAPPAERSERLKSLLVRCWRPVFAYIRHGWCSTNDDAMDLTQEFILQMLEDESLEKYERERSRFRRFLKACLQNFLHREHRDAGRLKRGGGHRPLSLEGLSESRSALLPAAPEAGPEEAFDREWAANLLLSSSERLREDLAQEGKPRHFEIWRLCVLERPFDAQLTYKDAAGLLGMTEAAVREALHQLRRRYREILLARVSDGVASAEDLFSELLELFTPTRGAAR